MKNYESTRLFKSKCADYHFQKDYIANLKKQQPYLFDDNLLLKTIDSNNIKTKLLVESRIAKMKEKAVQEYINDVEETFAKIEEEYGETKRNIYWDYLVEKLPSEKLEKKYMYSSKVLSNHVIRQLYDNEIVLQTIEKNEVRNKNNVDDNDVKEQITHFKKNARKYKESCMRAHELNQQIERLVYIMAGESGIRYDREQTDGGSPVNIDKKYLKLIEKIDKLKTKIEFEKKVINYVDSVIDKCSPLSRLYLIEAYVNNNATNIIENNCGSGIGCNVLRAMIKKEIRNAVTKQKEKNA